MSSVGHRSPPGHVQTSLFTLSGGARIPRGVNPRVLGKNLLHVFGKTLAENRMKMKEILEPSA